MSVGAGNGASFHVIMSQNTRAHVKQLHLEAATAGIGHQFLVAFRQIIHRLQHDPGVFGEPVYSLPALSLRIRKGAVRPLVVDYGVHDEKPLVFIRGFKVLS